MGGVKMFFCMEKKSKFNFFLILKKNGWSALEECSFEVYKDLKVTELVATNGAVGLYMAKNIR